MSSLNRVIAAQRDWRTAIGRERAARARLRATVEAAREDHTLAEIGLAIGLTRTGVHNLLNKNGR